MSLDTITTVEITCDSCGLVTKEDDEGNLYVDIKGHLERMKWVTIGDEHYCNSCK